MLTADFARAHTRAWVERVVIGLGLCPFARAPQVQGLVRYIVSEAHELPALIIDLQHELESLAKTPDGVTETTLLIHPWVLNEFADYNDFLALAEELITLRELAGVIQVAGFHPQYQFAHTRADDLGNATNRTPYPTLHLLREDSVSRAVAALVDAEGLFHANIRVMQGLGAAGWAELQAHCREDALGRGR